MSRSQDREPLAALVARVLPPGLAVHAPVGAATATGAVITGEDGRRWIDFASGIGTLATGHRHPRVMAAAREQLDRLVHTCFSVMAYRPYAELVARLVELAPGDFPRKGVLFNSGAEAVENAIKVARAATGRGAILCFEGAFHGRTLLTLALTGRVSPYKKGFGPFPGDVYRVPYPYCYRCPVGRERASCRVECRDLLARALAGYVDPGDLAAVVIEPQLGEGGFVPAPAEFLRAVREACDRAGAVLIVDEVQTGFGRTGTLFAIEQAGVAPDLLVLGKSLASGFPLSAVVGRADLLDAVQPGGLGGTYGGNPVACAAALATLDVIRDEDLPGRAREIGRTARARLEDWQRAHPEQVGDVRGLGAMLAVEVVRDRASREPWPALAREWTRACFEEGVLVLTAGVAGNVVRLLPPLVIEPALLRDGLDRMERALATALERVGGSAAGGRADGGHG